VTGRRAGRRARAGSDRGAILVHVAIALLALMSLTMFVTDYGVFWLARRQAQNVADAAALGGAMAIAYDDAFPHDETGSGVGAQSALAVAARHAVFDAPAAGGTAVSFPAACPDGTDTCIRVNVLRTAAQGNPLPAFFGDLVGKTTQDLRATATAQAGAANASACLAPFALPDRWTETTLPMTPASTFDAADAYTPPTADGTGTGYSLEAWLGADLALTLNPVVTNPTAGGFASVQVWDGVCATGNCFREAISTCSEFQYTIGSSLFGTPGSMSDVVDGIQALIQLDSGADWIPGTGITGSCVTTGSCPQYRFSPRILTIPLVNPALMKLGGGSGGSTIQIVNFLAFFVDEVESATGTIRGYVTRRPGRIDPEGGIVSPASGFLKTVMLVR
jgi:Flp pilus assembly protein TadG